MRITRAQTPDDVAAASHLFDGPLDPTATLTFLDRAGHWMLLAREDERVVGFVSGVETVHPDKGVEMYVNELGVQQDYQRRGIGAALVRELASLARYRGCTALWVATEPDNAAAIATYRSVSGVDPQECVIVSWPLD